MVQCLPVAVPQVLALMYHLVWGWELTMCERRPPLGEVPAGKLAPGEVPGRALADTGCVRLHHAIYMLCVCIYISAHSRGMRTQDLNPDAVAG